MSNVILVVVDSRKSEYCRYINRVKHIRVRAEESLTAAEVEGFRQTPTLYVEGMPPEPVRRA